MQVGEERTSVHRQRFGARDALHNLGELSHGGVFVLVHLPEELGQVAEGVRTTQSAKNLGKLSGVEMPITEEVYKMLYEDKPAPEVLRDLLGRERKAERD